MDEAFAGEAEDRPTRLRLDTLIDAVTDLHSQMQADLDRQEHRAEAASERAATAERDLEFSRSELARVRAELDQTRQLLNDSLQEALADRRAADERHSRLLHGLRDFVAENSRMQQALLAVTRKALGVAPLPRVNDEPAVGANSTAVLPAEPYSAATSGAAHDGNCDEHPDAALGLHLWVQPTSSEGSHVPAQSIEREDAVTAEVQIIDSSNAIDLRRLDAPRYMRSFRMRRAHA